MTTSPSAAIVTVGNELLCGDVENTNASWLAVELERLGLAVRIIATVPDDRTSIASCVRWAHRDMDVVVVTGGLGTTPDDLTREGIAEALGVPRHPEPELADRLAKAGGHQAAFAAEWSLLPYGSRPLPSIAGGAPAFAVENVYVLAGEPGEMKATFERVREELRAGPPRVTWKRRLATTEDRITALLDELTESFSGVSVGSYPTYGPGGPELQLVLRSAHQSAVQAAAAHAEARLRAMGIA